MTYTLFVADDCHQCDEVADFVRAKYPEVDIIDIDHSTLRPPADTFVFPALFDQEQLLAYGQDIIAYLSSK